ncbi:MAG TPA: FtsX-like permease family protein [Vicinamibacterales bacterium]|nr:FtsX-like permease family protein [Vicinamibacterales bacterium]
MTPALWPLVERFVGRRVPPARLEPVLGDLLEEFDDQVRRRGRIGAELWLIREGWSIAAAYRRRSPATAASSRTLMDTLRADVIHAWRAMRARPAAALATIAVLALGIGLVSAMFALADPYLLRPLPYREPDALVRLLLRTRTPENVPRLGDWQSRHDLFDGVAADGAVTLPLVSAPMGEMSLRLRAVSANFFDLIGVPVSMPAHWRPASPPAETPVILTAEAARRLFGDGRGSPIGALLSRTDDEAGAYRVTAVLPASFLDPNGRSATSVGGYVPLADGLIANLRVLPGGGYSYGSVMSPLARLRAGVTPAMVQAALSTGAQPAGGGMPTTGAVVVATPLGTLLTARVRPLALGALGAGALILLVCATNVANLLLTRGASRTREIAAREALGASGIDIVRLVFVELGLLAAAGVAAGLVVANAALAAAAVVIPAQYTSLGAPALTWRVAVAACAAGALVMGAGLAPAWAAWRVTPLALVSQTSAVETRSLRALRFLMTAAETAVAIVLVAGAVLFGRSYVNLLAQDPGYDGNTLAVSAVYHGSPDALAPAIEATIARLGALPGVTQAGASPGSLVDGLRAVGVDKPLVLDGRRVPGGPRQVSADFFQAAGARLVTGRLPSAADGGRAIAVSQSFAEACCEGRSPVGHTIVAGSGTFVIVGVVKDLYTTAFDEPPRPTVYVPIGTPGTPLFSWVNFVVHATDPSPALATALEREIRAAAPGVTIQGSDTLRARLMQSVNDRSFATLLVVFFAVAAAGVVAAGILGVVGFVAARRTREIAIRMAIGATSRDVARLVTRDAAVAAGAGAVLGLVGAAWLSKTVTSWLYGIRPADPLSLVLAALVMTGVVVVAAWLPARRATRLAPTIALRAE